MPASRGAEAIHGAFGPIFEAVWDGGFGAATLWDAYKRTYDRLGVDRPPATIFDMNTYRSWLSTLVGSARNLGRASDADALIGDHMAHPFGWVPNAVDTAAPQMVAWYEIQVSTAEGVATRWNSIAYNTLFPATVGELRTDAVMASQQRIDLSTMEAGEDSPTLGGQVVGLGRMYVTART